VKTAVEERRINVGGLSTRYFTAGNDGLPLVLLHGDSASALDWSWVLPKLGATHQVYAPDFPVSGRVLNPTASIHRVSQAVLGGFSRRAGNRTGGAGR
jgi:4,5:9,10-diseco-3-hydroxy-5,9,17-trioxoandrosta-1(10),2-diene-4-oate hydrolase